MSSSPALEIRVQETAPDLESLFLTALGKKHRFLSQNQSNKAGFPPYKPEHPVLLEIQLGGTDATLCDADTCQQPMLGTHLSFIGARKWVKPAGWPQLTCAAVPPTQSSKESWCLARRQALVVPRMRFWGGDSLLRVGGAAPCCCFP